MSVSAEGWLVGKSANVMSDVGGPSGVTLWKSVQEKPRSEDQVVAVPKLTQVGKMNILRRARELSLRNSAN